MDKLVNEALQVNPTGMSLLESWGTEIGAINDAFDNNLPMMKQITTAVLLESTQNHIDNVSRQILNENATQPADVGFFKKYAINLLSAVIPNLIAQDIVSVQPMLNRVGEIRFLKILYGSNKGQVRAGDTMMSMFHAGNGETMYSHSNVDSEDIDSSAGTSLTGNLAWTPIFPGTIEFLFEDASAQVVVVKDNGSGQLVGTGVTGTINYQTGAYSVTLTTAATNATVNYTYNNMDVPVQAPEVVLKIESAPIIAKSRKLKAVYAFDAALTPQSSAA